MIVRSIVLIFGPGKQSFLAMRVSRGIPMKNLINADYLFRARHRQHSHRRPVQHGKNARVYANA